MNHDTLDWGTELSAFDYMMFRADMDTKSRTTIMQIETLDVVPDWDRLRTELDRTSRIALRLRQRVVAPVVPLTPARWVVDPDFDLDYHVRRVQLPGSTSLRQLLDFAQTMFHDPLDPNRPLWEMVLVEGLDDDGAKAAMVWKLSHATIDGVGGAVLDELIRSAVREPGPWTMPPLPIPEDLTSMELTQRAVKRLPLRLVGSAVRRGRSMAGLGMRALRDPAGLAGQVTKMVSSARHTLAPESEPSPLLRGRSLQRRFDTHVMPLQVLRKAARAHGCSLNDAYLAALAGAMRRYHDALGVPIESITCGMPINVRADSDPAGGNQWSAASLALPVSEADPVRRMQAIRERVITARSDAGLNLMALVSPIMTWLPLSLLSGLGGGSLGIDIQASNVPGSPVARYVAGARILRSIPIGPLPGVAMMATMVSQDGQLHLGLNVDPAAFTDHELLMSSIRAGFDEVIAATPAEPATPAKRPRKPRKTT